MKKIIFIKNLNSEEDIEKIKLALIETRADYSVSLANKAVMIEGNNDILHSAKIAIREAGYVIE